MTFTSYCSHFCAMLALVACSDPGTGEQAVPPGNLANGRALVDKSSCTLCHYSDYGGAGFNPNITPDAQFGLGKWTDAQVTAAIRRGLSIDGTSLCPLMVQFPFSDQEVSDVITFLRSLPAVTRANGSACPGHGGKAM